MQKSNIENLKLNIQQSNLPAADKETLIQILSQKKVNTDLFLKTFFRFCDLTTTIYKVFDIDIGDF